MTNRMVSGPSENASLKHRAILAQGTKAIRLIDGMVFGLVSLGYPKDIRSWNARQKP